MKPYIIQSATLTDYEGRQIEVPNIKTKSGMPLVSRRPLPFMEDELICFFNSMFHGRLLITGIKLNIKSL